jgi:catechol 2,3-dioxygenase-like lactoylglutathione lyase family enzyme
MYRQNARLDQINIVSGDLDASIAFYRRLGVDIPEQRVWRTASGIHHASAGETENSAIDFDLDNATFAGAFPTARGLIRRIQAPGATAKDVLGTAALGRLRPSFIASPLKGLALRLDRAFKFSLSRLKSGQFFPEISYLLANCLQFGLGFFAHQVF